ncbi:MAG TPA: ATP-binding protein [Abditibacteriaceae bacterium]
MHGFRRTLFLSHLGLVALTLLLLAVTLRGLATRFFAEQLRDRLISSSALARTLAAPRMDGDGFDDGVTAAQKREFGRELRRMARRERVRIRLVNRNARTIYDTYQTTTGTPELGWSVGDRGEVIAALQGETNSVVRGSLREGSSEMFLAMPVRRQGEIVGCVYTTAPVLTLTPIVIGYARRLIIVTLAVFALAALLSIALSQRLALPARRLEEATRRLASGDLSARVAMHRRLLGRGDELDTLTREFNAMAEQIEKIDEERRAFLADVSHELRTPLCAIKGSAETLRDGAWQDARIAPRFAGTIVAQSDRLIRLVSDLLKLARLESTSPVSTANFFAPVTVSELLQRAADAVASLFEEGNVHLNIESAAGEIEANSDLLEQLLINLLANAARHSPPGSITTLAACIVDGETLLEVRDEGKGIAPEHLPKLGQRFYRVEGGRDRESGGSGLGLAICRRIAVAHGGRLEITSEEGRGTTVRVWLP